MKKQVIARIKRLEHHLSVARAFYKTLEDETEDETEESEKSSQSLKENPSVTVPEKKHERPPKGATYGQKVKAVLAAVPAHPAFWTIDDVIGKMEKPLPRKIVVETVNGLVKRNIVRRHERGFNNRPAKFQKTAA